MTEPLQPRRRLDPVRLRIWASLTGLSVAIVSGVAAMGLRDLFRPGWTEGATLWSPVPGLSGIWVPLTMIVAPLAALIWPRWFFSLRGAVILFVSSFSISFALDMGVSRDPAIAFWPTQIERRSWFGKERWPVETFEAIETRCDIISRRRRPDRAEVEIRVITRDGEAFRLMQARQDLDMAEWERRADALQDAWMEEGVVRRLEVDEQGVARTRHRCLTILHHIQDEAAFARSRRLLGLSDQTLREFDLTGPPGAGAS